MIDLYYWPTPNGKKVTILLEETGLPYKVVPLNIGRGDQFTDEFLKLNPNHRMPAIVDHEPLGGGGPLGIFESGAIMMYLAEKAGKFWPQTPREKYDGSSGRWRTRGRSSANADISAGSAPRRATSPMPCAASPTRRTGFMASSTTGSMTGATLRATNTRVRT
jgi:glutathione S-transferase